MIFATSVREWEYRNMLRAFEKAHPERAWALTAQPEGDPYYFDKLDAYCCMRRCSDKIVEVTGAFRLGTEPGLAQAACDLARTLGYRRIILDCFSQVAPAWARAGFAVHHIEKFNEAFAPSLWRPEYGRPDVLYMTKEVA